MSLVPQVGYSRSEKKRKEKRKLEEEKQKRREMAYERDTTFLYVSGNM